MNRFGTDGLDSPVVQDAIRTLRNGDPLPVDLYIQLTDEVGVDAAEDIIDTYGD